MNKRIVVLKGSSLVTMFYSLIITVIYKISLFIEDDSKLNIVNIDNVDFSVLIKLKQTQF